MKLDESFAREVKKAANGDGSREAKFSFLRKARECKQALSTPEIMQTFNDSFKQFGRIPVAVCVAASCVERKDRIGRGYVQWGEAVLSLWTNAPSDKLELAINDGLHPSRIEEYAGSFIRLTSEQ